MFPTGLTSVYNGQILDRFMKNRNKEGRRNVKQYKMAIMYEIKMIVNSYYSYSNKTFFEGIINTFFCASEIYGLK